MPTLDELNGDFSLRLRCPDRVVGTAHDGVIRDPALTGICTRADRTACFPGNIIYLSADVGSVGGGWLSSAF